MSEPRRLVGSNDVISSLAAAPLALAGLAWLVSLTDLNLLRREWPVFLLFAALLILFNQIYYFLIVELRTDRYGSSDGSFASTIQWTAAFLFGPTTLWLSVLWAGADFLWRLYNAASIAERWSRGRSFFLSVANSTLAYIAALWLYQYLGGAFPLADLSAQALLPAIAAIVAQFIFFCLIWGVYLAYAIWIQKKLQPASRAAPVLKFLLLAFGLSALAHPFAILAAGLFIQNGLFTFLFLMIGLLTVAYLARLFSWAAESSRQQSRQLEKLEKLGRAIIDSTPDASALLDILDQHIPDMFPSGRIALFLFPDLFLMKHPPEWEPDLLLFSEWVVEQAGPVAFLSKDRLPWSAYTRQHSPVVAAPIRDVETQKPVGWIYMELRSLAQPWDRRALSSLFPAVSSLAAQIASALHQVEIYNEVLEYQKAVQELAFAGRIQASFLPREIPRLSGWSLAVTLLPARKTSGDFFDFIPLSDGKLGILVADVADKGLGAALYMALSRTLIRTFALEYESQPNFVFFAANERILKDASANLFVTAFYGVLDQTTGLLTYCNAGHNPPLLLSAGDGNMIKSLNPTGIPVGIDEETVWTQATVQMLPGDLLVLYTDGIPDAQDEDEGFFGEKGLVNVILENRRLPAQELQNAILAAVQDHAGTAAQFDDITLIVLLREKDQQ